MVVETQATLKVARTSAKRVLINFKVANCISKGTIVCSYVPAKDESTTDYRARP